MRATLNSEITKNTIRRQNISGFLFATVYIINFIIIILLKLSSNDPSIGALMNSLYLFPSLFLGILAVVSFIMLYTISSNISSDIFATCMIMIELFFSLALPAILYSRLDGIYNQILLLWICVAMSCMAVVLWIMLFSNNEFPGLKGCWLALLPIPYLINLCRYLYIIGSLTDTDIALLRWTKDTSVTYPLTFALIPLMIVGYWNLCHSSAYSNDKEAVSTFRITLSKPVNIIYTVAVVAIFVIYAFSL